MIGVLCIDQQYTRASFADVKSSLPSTHIQTLANTCPCIACRLDNLVCGSCWNKQDQVLVELNNHIISTECSRPRRKSEPSHLDIRLSMSLITEVRKPRYAKLQKLISAAVIKHPFAMLRYGDIGGSYKSRA